MSASDEIKSFARFNVEWGHRQRDEIVRLCDEAESEKQRAIAAMVADRDALKAAKAVSDELLKEAKDIFDGELSLCDDADTSEWLWKWKVRYYFEDTDIPPHPLPDDMKGDAPNTAATLSGLYNCEVCGQEKCAQPGICDDCLAPPTEEEITSWGTP